MNKQMIYDKSLVCKPKPTEKSSPMSFWINENWVEWGFEPLTLYLYIDVIIKQLSTVCYFSLPLTDSAEFPSGTAIFNLSLVQLFSWTEYFVDNFTKTSAQR